MMNRQYGLCRMVLGFALMGIVGLLSACSGGGASPPADGTTKPAATVWSVRQQNNSALNAVT